MERIIKKKYDVVIIGGGPAGSTLGSYLAKSDIDCVIFEKEQFPRPHVGESLVASSTLVLQELNLIEKMEQAGFLKKYGALWTTEKNNKIHAHNWEDVDDVYHMEVEFKDRVLDGVKQNHTYHVDREKFDHLLLNHAIELGCHVFENHKISKVDVNSDNVSISVTDNKKNVLQIQSNIIVDASGRNTFLGKKYKWKIKDPIFNQFVVHTWFKNYERLDSEDLNTTIHFLPIANSWIWQIPITDEITSIGIVAQKEHFVEKKDLVEDYFWDTLKSRPDIYSKLLKAEKIREFITEGDYSYAMKEFTSDRTLLIGDAARFVDPIFASGVSIAMQSAKFASKDIIKAVKNQKFDRSQFDNYKNLLQIGCKNWHTFITLYYRLNVMFTYFLGKDEYRYDILKFLQGDVYDEENPKLLQAMSKFVKDIENNPKHPLHDYLGNLTANKFSK